MIEIRLFGDLRSYAANSAAVSGTAIYVPVGEDETVGQVLAQVGIDPAEVSNVFLNGRLLPRSIYPILLGYPLADPIPQSLEGYLSTPVRAGDRLGVFPRNMGMVVV
jgi:hypothetical protein